MRGVVRAFLLCGALSLLALLWGCNKAPAAENRLRVQSLEIQANSLEKSGRSINILFAGIDKAANHTDAMMLISLVPDQKRISVLQLPRDTFYRGYGQPLRVNQILSRESRHCANNSPEQRTTQIIAKLLGVSIDHYLFMDLDAFGTLVDDIGGVPIDIPAPMYYDDPSQELKIDFPAGKTVLNGKRAQAFVRFRSEYITGDLGRLDAQKVFLSALFDALLSKSDLKFASKLLKDIKGKTKTDLSLAELTDFVRYFAANRPFDDIRFMTLPGEATRYANKSGAWYYIPYKEASNALLAQYFNGGAFDKDQLTTDLRKQHFQNIYCTTGIGYRVYLKEDLKNLKIPRVHRKGSYGKLGKEQQTAECRA